MPGVLKTQEDGEDNKKIASKKFQTVNIVIKGKNNDKPSKDEEDGVPCIKKKQLNKATSHDNKFLTVPKGRGYIAAEDESLTGDDSSDNSSYCSCGECLDSSSDDSSSDESSSSESSYTEDDWESEDSSSFTSSSSSDDDCQPCRLRR